jgi:hypothetical protein
MRSQPPPLSLDAASATWDEDGGAKGGRTKVEPAQWEPAKKRRPFSLERRWPMAADTQGKGQKQQHGGASKTPPCHKVRLGAITAAVWKRELDNGRPVYNTTFSKLYRDSGGNWADTGSFGRDDLLLLAKVADLVHTWICDQQQRDRQSDDFEAAF